MVETHFPREKRSLQLGDEVMFCGRQLSLVRYCDLYAKEYAEAVMKLSGVDGKIAKDDWHLAWKLADRAREKSTEFLLQLRRHKEEHGC